MAYVTPYTFVALSTLTAAQLNGIQSNISALWPYTMAGDVPYASTSNTLARLGIGNSGNALSVSPGGVPAWGGLACAKLYLGTPVSINNSTDYIIQFTQEVIDDYGYADISSQPTRITIPAGVYLVFGHIEWALSTQYDVKILRGGGLVLLNSYTNKAANFIYFSNTVGNYIEIQVKHTYGSSLNLNNAELNVIKIG